MNSHSKEYKLIHNYITYKPLVLPYECIYSHCSGRICAHARKLFTLMSEHRYASYNSLEMLFNVMVVGWEI